MEKHFVPKESDFDEVASPGYADLRGHNVVIGPKYDPECVVYHVSGLVDATECTPRYWILKPLGGMKGARSEFKTDFELQAPEGLDRFRIAAIDPVYGRMRGRGLSLALVTRDDAGRMPPKLWWTRKFMASDDFCLSRIRFEAFVKEELEKPGTPEVISFSNFHRFYHANEETLWSDPEALTLPRTHAGGRPRDPWGEEVAKLLAEAIEGELMKLKPTAEGVLDAVRLKAGDGAVIPSLQTVQNRLAEVPKVVNAILGKGRERATRSYGHAEIRPRPDRPLEEVEGDEVTLDFEVLDDVTYIKLGRPTLFMLVDRRTGIVLSGTLGLSASFELLARGIRKSIYPTESPFEGVHHRWYGKAESYVLDAAKWNLGENMAVLKASIGVDVLALRKEDPVAKGAVEQCNRHVNEVVSHNAPGAVQGNVADRREFEDTRVMPLVTLGEAQGIVDDWIANRRNVKAVENLGLFRRMKAVPDTVWRKEIGKAKARLPVHPEIFDRMTGRIKQRTIQKEGVRIDHLTYWSDSFHDVVNHRDHKDGRGKHGGTRYTFVQNAGNAGVVTMIDPHSNRSIECRVVPTLRSYADNLPLDVHLAIVGRENEDIRLETKELVRRRTAAEELATLARAERRRRGIDNLFDRYRRDQKAKRIASEVRVPTASPAASAGLLDVRNPDIVPATENTARTTLGTVPDPAKDPAAKRRYAKPRDGGKELDRGRAASPLPPVSNLSVDVESDLDDL